LTGATLTAIGFDADDTLWQNEQFFRLTEQRFADLLRDHGDHEIIGKHLLEAERRNLAIYGFGIKGFTLSMIETAIEVTAGNVPASVIQEILLAGREMLHHPVETLAGVPETLESLAGKYQLIMITKGDLFDQERKLAASGLGDFFNAIEIVSGKHAATYDRIFRQHGTGPAEAMMIGNSLKSDILPALEAGAHGVFVPHNLTWALEHADEPTGNARFHKLVTIGELPGLIERL